MTLFTNPTNEGRRVCEIVSLYTRRFDAPVTTSREQRNPSVLQADDGTPYVGEKDILSFLGKTYEPIPALVNNRLTL